MLYNEVKAFSKKIIIRFPKTKKAFYIYKERGMRGVAIEIVLNVLFHLGLDIQKDYLRKGAVLLYSDSKHLNHWEKLFVAKKRGGGKQDTPGRQLLMKGWLPLEEV